MKTTREILENAKKASFSVNCLSTEEKNRALSEMAKEIVLQSENILKANALDMEAAKSRISPVMLDRLALSADRIKAMAKGIEEVVALPDPVGRVLHSCERGGMIIEKRAVPLGVVGIIYESRPNVTSDAASLALKSGNACVLRTGRDAWRSAAAITKAMQTGLEKAGVCSQAVQLIEDIDHASAEEMMRADGLIDLLIPRGGKGLIDACVRGATVPCIQTGTGICHIYVEKTADLAMALSIVENAKTSRPSVCNAEEVLLVDAAVAKEFLPLLKRKLVDERKNKALFPVELRLDERAAAVIDGVKARAEDFDTEFLDYILAVGVVENCREAVDHILLHSTKHSDAIITRDEQSAEYFCKMVDSAAVYVNASTRFTDGGVFGLGCEMGISTQKLHARGPMGLEELTTYKYIIHGNGNIR